MPLADSITTWRLQMNAVSKGGELGASDVGLRVFQPFFVEPNLPLSLTQDDVVTVPVAVFNYLDTQQTVQVSLKDADWFDVTGDATRSIELSPRQVKKVSFTVKALKAGDHHIRVDAQAGDVVDAVQRNIAVVPNGRRIDRVQGGELKGTTSLTVDIPKAAIAGSEDLLLKIYPGALSQVVEGMEGIFRMPNGCFEQTSSVTYPSLLVLDYMRRTETLRPDIQRKAERFINLGYQRLLTFEVDGGGFDYFGKGPSEPALTAYGLMEFTDMKRIQPVDDEMIARTQNWLLNRLSSERIGKDPRLSAYTAWALAESGTKDARLGRAVEALVRRVDSTRDNYVLALLSNALVANRHPAAKRALDRHRG